MAHPSHPEEGGLRLEVAASLDDILTSTGANFEWGGAYLQVEVALKNISEVSITVPTTAYDEKVNIGDEGASMERITIVIDSPRFQGKPTVYATSRFAPVVLAPGENVLLVHQSKMIGDRKRADSIKEFSVHFGVSSRFGGPKEWWKGHLETYVGITRSKDPDKEIQSMNAYQERYNAEGADKTFFPTIAARTAAMIAHADRVCFRGEMEKVGDEVVVRDREWIRAVSDAVATVPFASRVSCMCSGWRTAYFYKGDQLLVSVAAIHGNQLRIHWDVSGGDFPIDEDHWKAVQAALDLPTGANHPAESPPSAVR